MSKILYLRQNYQFGAGRTEWKFPALPRIDDQELYQLLDRNGISDNIHQFNDKLRPWEGYYNYHCPHGALQGQIPFERLIEKTRVDVSQGS